MAVISVSSTTLQLMAVSDKALINSFYVAIIRNESIPRAALSYAINGMAVNMRKFYNYAKDEYTLGLPQGKSFDYGNVNLAAVDAVLETAIGTNPILHATGAIYLSVTPVVLVYPYLVNTRKYNRFTDEILVHPPGITWIPSSNPQDVNVATALKKVELNSARVALDGVSIDIVYDLFIQRPVSVASINDVENPYGTTIEMQYVKESYTYTENVSVPSMAGITWGEDYLVAFYREYDATGLIATSDDIPWLYRVSSNVYPTLYPANTVATGVDYLPVIPLRKNNVNLITDARKDLPLYITSTKLAKIAKLDLVDLTDRIKKSPSNGDIDHAYVMYGVNLQTVVPESLRYLHKFFNGLYANQATTELDFLNKLGTVTSYGADAINTYTPLTVSEASFAEFGLSLYIDFDYITSAVTAGQVDNGIVGKISKKLKSYQDSVFTGMYYGESSGSYLPQYTLVNKGSIRLTLQIAPNVIHTITVYGLALRNVIYQDKFQTVTLHDVITNPQERGLFIPLQYQMAESFPLTERNAIYADALSLVLNSYEVRHLKWYESAAFNFVVLVIAVVAIVYSVGTLTTTIVGMLAAGASYLAVAIYIITVALEAYLLSMAADYLIKTYGAKIGIIGAVILAVVAIILTGGKYITASQFLLSTTQYVLQASMALISSANEFLVEEAQDIAYAYELFVNETKAMYDALAVSQDLLKNKFDIDPLMFTRPPRFKLVPNETPDAFYVRCLGLPDNTMYGIHDEIPTYFSARLQLPRLPVLEAYA